MALVHSALFHSIAVPLVATTKPTSCEGRKKHQDAQGGSGTWSERIATWPTWLHVVKKNHVPTCSWIVMTGGSDLCNKCWCLRTNILIVWSNNLRDVKEWHSRIWIKQAFQGYCFYFSTCTCLCFLSFLFFVIYSVISSCSRVWCVLPKGPQSYVHVRIDTSILATYACDCVYAYNADLDHTMALPLIPTAKGLQAPIHDHKPAQTECHDVIESDSRYPSKND